MPKPMAAAAGIKYLVQISAENLVAKDLGGKSDPYFKLLRNGDILPIPYTHQPNAWFD